MKQFKMLLNEVSYYDALKIFTNNSFPIHKGELNKDKHLALRFSIIFDAGVVHIANSKEAFEQCPFPLVQWQQFLDLAEENGWIHVRESSEKIETVPNFKAVLLITPAYNNIVEILKQNGVPIHTVEKEIECLSHSIIFDSGVVFLSNTRDNYNNCPFPELNYGELRAMFESCGWMNDKGTTVKEKTYTKRDVDFAYILGLMSIGHITDINKEVKRLHYLGKDPSDIIDSLK